MKKLLILLTLLVFTAGISWAVPDKVKLSRQAAPLINLSLENRAMQSLVQATDFLLKSQKENGSWQNDPAITSLVVYSLLLDPQYNPDGKSFAASQRGLDFIAGFAQPDGGIYSKGYRNYVTAVSLMALAQSNQKKYKDIIANAKNFLIQFQLDEGEGIDENNPYYGGIGYGGDDRPDMSNTQLAMGAIKSAEEYEARFAGIIPNQKDQAEEEKELGLHWKKALVFINRCQNNPDVNDMDYAGKDGGFIYETGHYKKDRSHSYGSMTYAGVKSLLYAQVDKNDPRVKKAVGWIASNYTLDFNPGFGTYSIFYYYMTFSKSLNALGEEVIVDTMGQEHQWRKDLIEKLVSIQKPGGFWQNPSSRYMENIPDLATAYSVIAMKFALEPTPQ